MVHSLPEGAMIRIVCSFVVDDVTLVELQSILAHSNDYLVMLPSREYGVEPQRYFGSIMPQLYVTLNRLVPRQDENVNTIQQAVSR